MSNDFKWLTHFGDSVKFDEGLSYVDTVTTPIEDYIRTEAVAPIRIYLHKLPETEYGAKNYMIQLTQALSETLVTAYSGLINGFNSWSTERLFTDRVRNITLALYGINNTISLDYSASGISPLSLESPFDLRSDDYYWRRRLQGLVLNYSFVQRMISSDLRNLPSQAMFWER